MSRGDDELLDLGAHHAWHFPQDEDGAYVGYHPHDSAEAITHLEALRSAGRALPARAPDRVLVARALPQLRAAPEQRYQRLTREDEGCLLFELSLNRPPAARGGAAHLTGAARALSAEELREEVIRLGPWHVEVEITPEVSTAAFLDAPAGDATRTTSASCTSSARTRASCGGCGACSRRGWTGRRVLDCACNCGYFLFWSKELGAGECLGFDAREHWIRQARFLAAHRAQPSDGIRFEVCDLYDLPALDPGRFDVTFFNGIFYHLPEPDHGPEAGRRPHRRAARAEHRHDGRPARRRARRRPGVPHQADVGAVRAELVPHRPAAC